MTEDSCASIPCRAERSFSSPSVQALGPTESLIQRVPGMFAEGTGYVFSRAESRQGLEGGHSLRTRLRMSTTEPSCSLYAFIGWTGTALPLLTLLSRVPHVSSKEDNVCAWEKRSNERLERRYICKRRRFMTANVGLCNVAKCVCSLYSRRSFDVLLKVAVAVLESRKVSGRNLRHE